MQIKTGNQNNQMMPTETVRLGQHLLLSSCGRPNRPHNVSCPSVRLSVCLVRAPNSHIKVCRKTQVGVNIRQSMRSQCDNFQFKRSPNVENVEKSPHIWCSCLLTGCGSRVRRLEYRLQARPNYC